MSGAGNLINIGRGKLGGAKTDVNTEQSKPAALQALRELGQTTNGKLVDMTAKARQAQQQLASTLAPRVATANGAPAVGDGTGNARSEVGANMRSDMTLYDGVGGKKAVKVDNPILVEQPVGNYRKDVYKAIRKRFQGNNYKIGESDKTALVSDTTAGKISRRGTSKMTDIEYKDKGNSASNLNEMVENMHNVRFEPNKDKASNIKGVIRGDIEVDVNGKKIYPQVVIREYKDGTRVIHEISETNRTPSDFKREKSGGVREVPLTERSSDTSSIAKTEQKVNSEQATDTKILKKAESKSVIYEKNINNSDVANKAVSELSREYDPIINKDLESFAEKQIKKDGVGNSYEKAVAAIKRKGTKITTEEKATALKTLQTLGSKSDDVSIERFTNLSEQLAKVSRTQA
jgi:hypothetical protein